MKTIYAPEMRVNCQAPTEYETAKPKIKLIDRRREWDARANNFICDASFIAECHLGFSITALSDAKKVYSLSCTSSPSEFLYLLGHINHQSS